MGCISDLFSSVRCYLCLKPNFFLCSTCARGMHQYNSYCYVCKRKSKDFFIHEDCQKAFFLKQVIVLTSYKQKGIKKLLSDAKYYGKYKIYNDIITHNEHFFQKYMEIQSSIMVPIPMHFFRKWKRGYNQTCIIAKKLGKILGVPVRYNALYRRYYTPYQSHLSKEARMKNVSGVFGVRDLNMSKDSIIYLIDDIASTGYTLHEAASMLKIQGYKDIRAIVLASD